MVVTVEKHGHCPPKEHRIRGASWVGFFSFSGHRWGEQERHLSTLTERQREILSLIREHFDRCGYAPTLRELSRAAGIASLSVVDYHLNKLVDAGKIVRDSGIARGLRVVDTVPVQIGEEIEATDLDGVPIGRVLFLSPVPKAA